MFLVQHSKSKNNKAMLGYLRLRNELDLKLEAYSIICHLLQGVEKHLWTEVFHADGHVWPTCNEPPINLDGRLMNKYHIRQDDP